MGELEAAGDGDGWGWELWWGGYSAGMGQEVTAQRLKLAVDRRRDGGVGDKVGLGGPFAGEGGESSGHCGGEDVRGMVNER